VRLAALAPSLALSACVATSTSPAPTAAATAACPPDDVRHLAFADGERAFAEVEVGWTVDRVRALVGDPRSCDAALWHYQAGHPDGPLATLTIEVSNAQVVRVERGAAGCILRE
jgi:hypothetical protein